MKPILFHKQTEMQVQNFLRQPSPVLLIIGAHGSSKSTLARLVTAKILELDDQSKLDNYSYFTYLKKPDDKQDISIDEIRRLIKHLHLKTPGTGAVRRVV